MIALRYKHTKAVRWTWILLLVAGAVWFAQRYRPEAESLAAREALVAEREARVRQARTAVVVLGPAGLDSALAQFRADSALLSLRVPADSAAFAVAGPDPRLPGPDSACPPLPSIRFASAAASRSGSCEGTLAARKQARPLVTRDLVHYRLLQRPLMATSRWQVRRADRHRRHRLRLRPGDGAGAGRAQQSGRSPRSAARGPTSSSPTGPPMPPACCAGCTEVNQIFFMFLPFFSLILRNVH